MGNFYSRLSYSFGNEDWKTEQKALRIEPTDRVVSVTASGDRPLNLLTTELAELVTIDANPMQTALFDLKQTALKQLDFPEYLSFLGADPHPNRYQAYTQFEQQLAPDSIKLWDRQTGKIARGILYEGAVEKWLQRMARILRPLRGQKIDTLFSFDDIENQRTYLKESWHTYLWQKTFQISLHPWITRYFISDPGLYAYVDKRLHIGDHLYDKLHSSLDRFLAKESVLLALIFKGKVEKSQFPPYLTEEGATQIRNQLDRVKFDTKDMLSYLEGAPDQSINCFSCSDIASYIDAPSFEKLVRQIHRTAAPGARFCIRQFLSNQQIPADLTEHFQRDHQLEEELEKEDRCFVYRFMCGTIN